MYQARKRKSFPRLLGEYVEQVARPALEKHGMAEMKIIRHWEAIVGAPLAAHASPHRVIHSKSDNGDVLVVRCSGGFALEIQHGEPLILERIATYLGYRAIARLRIEQVAAPAPKRKAAQSPADAAMREQLRQLAETLLDDGC